MTEPRFEMRYTNPPTWWARCALRLIGFGVLMLTTRPVAAWWAYYGHLANLGSWTLTCTDKVHPEP